MGHIGSSFSNLFTFATSGDAVIDFINAFDDSNLSVQNEGSVWGVLTGDQLLFEGASKQECDDFLFGLIVGAAIFSDMRSHPLWVGQFPT